MIKEYVTPTNAERVLAMLKQVLVKAYENPDKKHRYMDPGEILALIAKVEVVVAFGKEALGAETEAES